MIIGRDEEELFCLVEDWFAIRRGDLFDASFDFSLPLVSMRLFSDLGMRCDL